MKLIFIGPPGAGKGTIAKSIIDRYGICQISTGDIFRAAVKDETELGKKVKAILDSGGLVPDELTIALVKERLGRDDIQKGFILDGFPRTIAQAEALDSFESIDAVIDFVIEDRELILRRLGGRLTCKKCSAIYNKYTNPPVKPDTCDRCHGELYVRKDDERTSILHRLDVYDEQTAPLKSYYAEKRLIREIDASKPEQDVIRQVNGILDVIV
jgi:adenylate kinase